MQRQVRRLKLKNKAKGTKEMMPTLPQHRAAKERQRPSHLPRILTRARAEATPLGKEWNRSPSTRRLL